MAKVILYVMTCFVLTCSISCQSNQSKINTDKPNDHFSLKRQQMVEKQIHARGIRNDHVLEAMRKVPRHEFVPVRFKSAAYDDTPLPIGESQTISQPYIVALMTELLELNETSKILEIGTGSGYQAAILAEIVREVYTIEIIDVLSIRAQKTLARLAYQNIYVKTGDGYQGWAEHAPFNGIIVTAAPDHIPQPLIEQLAVGGRMVIPVGENYQELLLLEKTHDETISKRAVIPVRFVPMTGQAEETKN